MKLSGWLVLDKPLTITSAQAVGIVKKKLRSITSEKVKIGHTGTLDPLATGVLPLAIGEATKLAHFFLDCSKAYIFTIFWGQQTDTADAEGVVIAQTDNIPSRADIESVIPFFIGQQKQMPPKFSALKINGNRAYDLARLNVDFELQERDIIIYSLALLSHDADKKQTSFSVNCSKGTYIRVLGEQIAQACYSLGHLSALRRTKVGFFSEKYAIFPDISEEMMYKAILGVTEPLNGISAIHVTQTQAYALRLGQSIMWQENFPDSVIFPAINDNNTLVALVSFMNGVIIPKRVFNL